MIIITATTITNNMFMRKQLLRRYSNAVYKTIYIYICPVNGDISDEACARSTFQHSC